jgi:hypothetical protein
MVLRHDTLAGHVLDLERPTHRFHEVFLNTVRAASLIGTHRLDF